MTDGRYKSIVVRIAKYIGWSLGVLLALIVITWIVLLIYVNNNEKHLIGKVSEFIEKRTKGTTSIGGLSVSFFRTFPLLSLQLEDVVIRDSLYASHKLDLLRASDVYLRASISGILMKKVPVGKVVIRDGAINLFTDSTGATNEFVLKSDKQRKPGDAFDMPAIELKNIQFALRNLSRKKYYAGNVRSLHCTAKKKNDRLVFSINMNLIAKNISFNTRTGSYLRNKPVAGKFKLEYAMPDKRLIIHQARLVLDGHPFMFEGFFNLDKNSSDFKLRIDANRVMYAKATAFLREPLEKKMNEYSISKPIDMRVTVSGKTAGSVQPLVEVSVNVPESKVGTPLGEFDECAFKGSFTNRMVVKKGTTDENSLIHLTDFVGRWERILVRSKNIRISNLITPYLECDVASDVDLTSLNTVAGSSSFLFLSGKSSVDVVFKGSVMGKDSVGSTITGNIGIYNASMKYLPRNFTLTDCDGNLKFVDNDLEVSSLTANAGKTRLNMKGAAKNFLSMLDVSPEKLLLMWDIYSPALHLDDFKPFLSKSNTAKQKENKKAAFNQTASKIDKLFAEGDMFINLRSPQMDYKTFKATDVEARVVMGTTEIAFEKVELKHAGGMMSASGSLTNGESFNPVWLETRLSNMNVPALFAAFENFGQDAVTFKNLSGRLSADVKFKTAVNNQAQLVSDANEGIVSFLLEDGELRNFEPLMEISKKAFKKQDFSDVKFADLENKLEVKGTTFIINEMDIRSTALNLTVEGIYDLKKGTDMSIRLPLRNLTKSQAGTDLSDDAPMKRGVGLRLRAKTGDDGKLKISWDPFRRSKKNKEEVQDSTDAGRPE